MKTSLFSLYGLINILFMKALTFLFTLFFFLTSIAQKNYFPPPGSWEKQAPLESGFDTAKLDAAINFAIDHETKQPRDLKLSQAMTFGKEPFDEGVGLSLSAPVQRESSYTRDIS